MITLKYKSIYQTKEESKEASTRIIKHLKSPIKSGSMVANEQQKNNENKISFLTTLDLNIQNEIIDFLEAKATVQVLSNKWRWNLSSVHTKGFNIHIEGRNIKTKTKSWHRYSTGVSFVFSRRYIFDNELLVPARPG